jgi:hypothetical protein
VFVVSKDPDGWTDFTIDWAAYLNIGDAIVSSAWSSETLPVSSASYTASTATAIISGGVVGAVYAVTNKVTTASGLVEDRTIQVVVEEH